MAIGLDIGSSAVRAVHLEQSRTGAPRLTHYAQVALPLGAVVDGDVVEPAVVAGALKELWDRAGIRGRAVAVGLASQRITVRQIDMPELSDGELGDAVRLQAQDQLPIPVDQALLDYVVVDRYTVGDDRRNVRLLLVAAEQEMVDRLLAAVTAAKLRPVVVDLDAFALIRSLADSGEDHVELVVDIGATVTKIAVHRGGQPLFVRMVRLGGDGATRALQEALDLDWDGAEAAKLDASGAMAAGIALDADDERGRVLEAASQRVVGEVRRSLDFFRAQHDDAVVQRAVISGGVSQTPALADQLESVLELAVEAGAPLRALDAAPPRRGAGELEQDAPFMGVAVGLARALLA